ncbi:MAG: hypothetical protein QM753_10965 [Thermomicrobiales bacterium]
MNLKKSFVGAVAGLALIGSIAAPVAQVRAGEGGDSAYAYISITTDGTFDLDLTNDIYFPGYNLNASNAWQTNSVDGAIGFTYTDTKAQRGEFSTTITATDFFGLTNSGYNTIPVSNFKIMSMPNPQQQYCCGGNYGIGGISNVRYPGTNPTNTDGDAVNWAPGVSFGGSPYIHHGWPGRGTGTTTGQLNVNLNIPSDTKADNYRSTVTATVSFSTP